MGYVQSQSNLTASSVTSLGATFGTAQTAGNSNFVGVVTGNSTQPTVADTDSNTYTLAASANNSSQGIFLWMFKATSIAAGSSNVVTASTTVATYMAIAIAEYSGFGGTLDGSAVSGSGGTGTAWATSNLTTTNANDLLFTIACGTNGGTITAGSGFTMRQTSTFFPQCNLEDETVTVTGTYAGTMTAGTSQAWCILMAAFQASGSAPIIASGSGSALVTGTVNPTLAIVPAPTGQITVTGAVAALLSPIPATGVGTIGVTGAVYPVLTGGGAGQQPRANPIIAYWPYL